MKSISVFLILLFFTSKTYSQRTADNAYNLFSEMDWGTWQNMDTVNCTNNRLDYTKHFDSLFVAGISRDTVEKYLGKGIDISRDNIWHGKVKTKKVPEEIIYYYLTWNCRFHGVERMLTLFYQNGKLKKYSARQAIIYD